MSEVTTLGLIVLAWLHGAFVGWAMRGEPDPKPADPNCPHCRGLGFDASGYSCHCTEPKP